MLQKLQLNQLHKFSCINRWNFIKTGLLISSLAICFIADRNYFFYPPSLAPAWNNIYFDIVGLIAGVILVVCGAFNLHIDLLVKIGLGVSVAFLTVLLVADSFHIFGVGYFKFHPLTVILEVYTIINLMQIAYEYKPRD